MHIYTFDKEQLPEMLKYFTQKDTGNVPYFSCGIPTALGLLNLLNSQIRCDMVKDSLEFDPPANKVVVGFLMEWRENDTIKQITCDKFNYHLPRDTMVNTLTDVMTLSSDQLIPAESRTKRTIQYGWQFTYTDDGYPVLRICGKFE